MLTTILNYLRPLTADIPIMNNTKYLLALLLVAATLLISCGGNDQKSISVKGRFTGAPEKTIVLFELFADSANVIDSTDIDKNGEFSFRIKPKEAGFYMVRFDGKNYITLSAEPGESIEILGQGNNLQNEYEVTGSPGSLLYRDYLMFTKKNQAKVDSLSEVFTESQSRPDFREIKKQLDSAYYMVFNNQQQQVRKFLHENGGNLVSLLVINRRFGPNTVVSPGTDLALFSRTDSLLTANYPGNSRITDFHKTLGNFKAQLAEEENRSKIMQPGSPEPDLRLPDVSGNTIRLSTLSGKPHLIYFWGSWNAPSRRMNLELVPVYNEFHEKGFEIYAIALDLQKDSWISAYRLDKATWINVNDFKGLESPAAKTCGAGSIPTTILVGADGLVKARNIPPAELKTWLMTHYK